jgi:hypothetical protein
MLTKIFYQNTAQQYVSYFSSNITTINRSYNKLLYPSLRILTSAWALLIKNKYANFATVVFSLPGRGAEN